MEIEFNDGTVKEVDVNVTALTLFNLQKEGVIDGIFLQGFMPKKGSNRVDLDPVAVLQAVYAAYRQANKQGYMKFNDFLENYSLDMETDMPIFTSVISKKAKKKFQENFAKKAALSSGKK